MISRNKMNITQAMVNTHGKMKWDKKNLDQYDTRNIIRVAPVNQ